MEEILTDDIMIADEEESTDLSAPETEAASFDEAEETAEKDLADTVNESEETADPTATEEISDAGFDDAEIPAEETVEEEVPAEEAVEESTATEDEEAVEPVSDEAEKTEDTPAEEAPVEETVAEEAPAEETPAEDASAEEAEAKPEKVKFKLTIPDNLQSILPHICSKRGRKLIYSPKEVVFDGTYKVLGTDKKNEEGIRVKDILDAEIKEGVRLGYLDKFDGLKTSEIKEEYENDVVYEFAEQEFKKTGVMFDGKRILVYLFDWDLKACHHVGYLDEEESKDLVPYLNDSENYSFDIYGIITGGKAKRVTKDESGKITVTKEKDGDIGLELDVSVMKRKD